MNAAKIDPKSGLRTLILKSFVGWHPYMKITKMQLNNYSTDNRQKLITRAKLFYKIGESNSPVAAQSFRMQDRSHLVND